MEPIVIARAPGHISFGWGSSLPGADAGPDERLTISAAINYYAYTIVSPCHADDVRITVAGCQTLPWYVPDDFPWGAELALPKAILRLFGTRGGLSIFLSTQAPLGIGLGLSGSLAVSMIKALAFASGLDLDPQEVADLACYVLAEASGSHRDDARQYAAACGGLTSIDVSHDKVRVDPLRITPDVQQSLEKHLMLFGNLSFWRPSSDAVRDAEVAQVGERFAAVSPESVRGAKRRVRAALECGDWETLGELLQRGWIGQRCPVNAGQDDPFSQSLAIAMQSGAFGGQGTRVDSGLLVLLCPEARQSAVTEALTAHGLQRLPLALEPEGVQVLEAVPRPRLHSIAGLREPALFGSQLLQPR